jgi:hypothetical protein
VERWFALLTERQLRRGVHRSTKELKAAIADYIENHNLDPKPFIWHKTADQSLESSIPSLGIVSVLMTQDTRMI